MRDTSILAFADLLEQGEITRRQADVLAFLNDNRGRNFSRREIAKLTGIELCSVTGRVNELLAKRLIVEDAKRACGITAKTVHPVRVAN